MLIRTKKIVVMFTELNGLIYLFQEIILQLLKEI